MSISEYIEVKEGHSIGALLNGFYFTNKIINTNNRICPSDIFRELGHQEFWEFPGNVSRLDQAQKPNISYIMINWSHYVVIQLSNNANK